MKILMVNKFLYPNGGSETYMFKLGSYLQSQGHEVQYFGMEHQDRCVGNAVNAYTSNMDFHGGRKFEKLIYPIKTIYSFEARKKIRLVLENFSPDIVHLNNYNFQITPSIIYEIRKFGVPIVQTVHDCQIACPNHRMYIEHTGNSCRKCLAHGNYLHCIKNRCVQHSTIKSLIAAIESIYYHARGTYHLVDAYICPSQFMADAIIKGGIKREKVFVLYNPIDSADYPIAEQGKYLLYFGRLSQEKGIKTLLQAAALVLDIPIVIAGSGPMEKMVTADPNVSFVGFKQDLELKQLIGSAVCSVYPSEWYENCPLSILESQALGVPVIGSDMGGTPELIDDCKTGLIFRAGAVNDLTEKIRLIWDHPKRAAQMKKNCLSKPYITLDVYMEDLIKVYHSVGALGE